MIEVIPSEMPSMDEQCLQTSIPAQPVVFKQPASTRSHAITMRERFPLSSGLKGPGRAGTVTTLYGSHGSKYTGQVLAGRPHGQGRYWMKEGKACELQLVYEGSFVRGVRHGQGTAYYHSRGEVYTGQWVDGRRTGPGKLTYADGSVFEGMWSKDVRHGVGTLNSPNGSIFVGTFFKDKRGGLGVTYWAGRGKKYVAEYVDDAPCCGVLLPLDDQDGVEAPASQQLRDAIAAARIKAAAAATPGSCAAEMPELQLKQPSQVVAKEFGAVRHWRERQQQQSDSSSSSTAALEAGTGTLASHTISLLRHSFILIAGGDDLAARVLRHQLQELVVLAGLDPADGDVVKLLGLLQQRMDDRGQGKLSLDDMLDVCAFYRATPLTLGGLQEQQQQQLGVQVEQQQQLEQQEEGAAEGTQAAVGEEWRVDPLTGASHSGLEQGGEEAWGQEVVDRPSAPVPEQSLP